VYIRQEAGMNDLILYDNITDEELQKVFKEIKHNRQRLDYIQRYYTERKNEYEIREFTSNDKKVIGTIEVHTHRDIKDHEIDEALFFVNKGYIVKEIIKKRIKGDFTGIFDELLFIKNGKITRIKNMTGLAEADTCHT